MALPLPDTEGLYEELNHLRSAGRYVTNDFRIRGLQKRINALKKHDEILGQACQASLWCLTGDVDSMLKAGALVLERDPDGVAAFHHVVTLYSSGFFSYASELFSQLDDQMLVSDSRLWARGYGCFAFERMTNLARPMDAEDEELSMTVANAHKVLATAGVPERDISRMLDIAGEVLRNHGLLQCGEPQVFVYPSHGSLTISLPLNLSAEEVAELEWEFCQRLFTEMPDAPAHVAQIGFCIGDVDGNG